MKRISKVLVFLLMTVTFSLLCMPAEAALRGLGDVYKRQLLF